MKLDIGEFLVPEQPKKQDNFDLACFSTSLREKLYHNKKDYQKQLEKSNEKLQSLQELLYAYDRYSMLLIFQGMDTAGKDGAIRHVMSGINPQGCQVFSFQQPSPEELNHDFMWRTNKSLPERGRIGIFNRSYYEEVIVVRVHPEFLEAEKLPPALVKKDKIWDQRFQDIVNAEDYLTRNGTMILKFFLHISHDEQRDRLLERLDDPEKHWKFSSADIEERKYWKQYQEAWCECLRKTSTGAAPWYVIPADDKKNARLLISEIVAHHMKELDMEYPKVSAEKEAELKKIRKQLAAE